MYQTAGFDFSKFRYDLTWNVLIPFLQLTESLLDTSNHSDPPLYTVPNKVPAPNKHIVTSGRRPTAPRASGLLNLWLPVVLISALIVRSSGDRVGNSGKTEIIGRQAGNPLSETWTSDRSGRRSVTNLSSGQTRKAPTLWFALFDHVWSICSEISAFFEMDPAELYFFWYVWCLPFTRGQSCKFSDWVSRRRPPVKA